ncbi:hypothetical protein Ssi03_77170 [Sphaerisporangium siamense]|uniref:Uncharacterized protein n=1 Tax=Sphaerisporangium siamense TaxID=795645 RepID=A0A7W7GAZ3_9ACTN|nr:hypothetical protein [Sphaerisporangium siamense]MBB4702265.1 hypothetical protein [Sphaerisporangium siamense]GII89727.1 hypothetical protein Ssi03_77170 [Sphaerisporangium siamense]
MPPSDGAAMRAAALTAAIKTHLLVGDLRLCLGVSRDEAIAHAEDAIRQTADTFAAWIAGTTRLRLIPGPVVDEATGAPAGATFTGEKMQLNTGQKITYTVDTEDASGYDTNETIEWSVDNADSLVLTVSEDTRSATVVSGAPGSGVLKASIPALGLEATEAIDIVPAGTATIKLVAGPVEEENPAPEQ